MAHDTTAAPIAAELPTAVVATPASPGRIDLGGRSLREHSARGVLVNSAFTVGLGLLTFVRGFVVAAFLTRADYGVWGVLGVSLGTLLWLKNVGIGDKYVQQDEEDQEAAFQHAFSVELTLTLIAVAVLTAALPLFCLLYGEWSLLLPGLAIVLIALPAGVFHAPLWIFYRSMRFARQRALAAVDPVVGFVVAVSLAVAGLGYWALVIGAVAGTLCAAVVAVLASPYRLRLRLERGVLREYWSFSWPLFVASGAGVVIAQSAVFASEAHLGLAGAGIVVLAANVTLLTDQVDHLVTGTLYPAICAVRDRTELLYETFVKSNRLALMWAFPFGLGLALFASDLVSFGLGERWRPAVEVLQITGIVAAVAHVGFNWEAFFRARGETRPMAVASVAAMVAFVGVGLPLLFAYDLRGLAIGLGVQGAVHVTVRAFYLRRLFHGFRFLGHALRAAVPTVPAVGAVLAVRAVAGGERTLGLAVAELVLFVAVAAAATWLIERSLLREMASLVRRRTSAPAVAVAA